MVPDFFLYPLAAAGRLDHDDPNLSSDRFLPRRPIMKCRLALVLLVLLSGACLPVRADDPPAPLLMQRPTLSKSHIVFGFAGDLWIVPRAGGEAKRLTSGAGVECDPAFSPDGKLVAFTG
jgi:tricorn protease